MSGLNSLHDILHAEVSGEDLHFLSGEELQEVPNFLAQAPVVKPGGSRKGD